SIQHVQDRRERGRRLRGVLLRGLPVGAMSAIFPSWSVHSWQRIQANMHGALSWHKTWLGARWAARGDDDLVVFGPYWPDWQKRAVCRIRGHRQGGRVAARQYGCAT